MFVYLINEIKDKAIFASSGVECVYGKEIHFKKQQYAKQLADYLSLVIKESSMLGEVQQITYAADIANSIVIAQKNLLVICSCEPISKYEVDCCNS